MTQQQYPTHKCLFIGGCLDAKMLPVEDHLHEYLAAPPIPANTVSVHGGESAKNITLSYVLTYDRYFRIRMQGTCDIFLCPGPEGTDLLRALIKGYARG